MSITTVGQAFDVFMKEKVNLDQAQVVKAKNSRNWLQDQICSFPKNDESFPRLYPNKFVLNYGSFARKTKIKPLDDIDMMIILSAECCTYSQGKDAYDIKISFPDNYPSRLDRFKETKEEKRLSSTKVINCFVNKLKEVDQYEKAEIKRTGEAATLKLKSYEWNFDILPCFRTEEEDDGRYYYLIPNGKGDWKKTCPEKDQKRLSSINKKCDGGLLNIIRLLKYWNYKLCSPKIPSYLLEVMISDYYKKQITNSRSKGYVYAMERVEKELLHISSYLSNNIAKDVQDPKEIVSNINELSDSDQKDISNKLTALWKKALCEPSGYGLCFQRPIAYWKSVFGDDFPDYESN